MASAAEEQRDVLAYLATVQRFAQAAGAPDAAPEWAPAALEGVRKRLPFMAAATSAPLMRWAVLMHLTAATRASLLGRSDAREAHYATAQALLPLAAPFDDSANAPDRQSLRRAVPLSAGYALLRAQRPAEAIGQIERALLAAPPDAQTLLALGMAEELVAASSLSLPQASREPGLVALREFQRRQVGSHAALDLERRRVIESSAKHLGQALELGPDLDEARLRLGRVFSLAGRSADARREWNSLLERGPEPALACLARLFLGRSAGQEDAWREAVEQYRAALASCPQAQSAHLALSLALDRVGDASSANLEARAALGLNVAADPWARYNFEPRRGVVELLEELRRQ